ncbi:aquaglyceroporin Gla [Streptococcus dysgalactiae]|uniref:aquaglyceroporin Gla n=1 Tax=Streptococcus dysgalactiae TaxID=1334 RepID=UPI001CF3484A|nr:aquaglyceroporin Gla [Streptococcus dysgalactiae]MCB2832161.1 aquaporin family protein [Streptococcus dysgalactiae subsp. dysgalactiae]MCB2836185.1 aquaporin family protein [Streptococcus dysgalactiae subsp. dysgalactiae]MCB2838062.1 aquaporin family protein [Streptococcus dysgalactiae subsp. dysgalactiae]MCB2839954.1 aquaporin family protein [Streptococcus dysgalactiae subsp. dysgalactiae]MCB2849648.1 aquaporin family protein [Streptococcus dysgalactiae subsp. dysgalactiae]
MDVTWTVKYITEFLATALLIILGNGAVANVDLKGTKGNNSGWIIIALGYGLAVMMPALMFGNVSGNHINPAFTLGLAVSGLFPWAHVVQYIIAQVLGAIFGQFVLVGVYGPYFRKTENPNPVLGSFSTISALDDGTKASHKASVINGFANEFAGSFVLFFGALALTKNFFGAELIGKLLDAGYDEVIASQQVAPYITGSTAVAHIGLGFLVMALVASLGGPTGPALNPARDFGPRLIHHLLPKSVLGEAKGDSKWWYSWVPVVAPILAGIAAVALFKFLYIK